jgi:SPX domain protein involved in polyphosphate accumulation
MKFGQQFEFHKIPEWYDEYLDYRMLKALLKRGTDRKLRGLYYLSKDMRSFRIDAETVASMRSNHGLTA